MATFLNTVITHTGSCIPEQRITNEHFAHHTFYGPDGKLLPAATELILHKFEKRLGIQERRWARDDQVASDLLAQALLNTGIDIRSIDLLVDGTNYGDIKYGDTQSVFVPSTAVAALSKAGYTEEQGYCKAFSLTDGCPSALEALITVDDRLRSDRHPDVRRAGASGTETLSRVADFTDRDGMIFADGSGVFIVDRAEGKREEGILSHATHTIRKYKAKMNDITDCADFITMGPEYRLVGEYKRANMTMPADAPKKIHMVGPNIAALARDQVKYVVAQALDRAKIKIEEVELFAIHQANNQLVYEIALDAGVPENQIAVKVPAPVVTWGNPSAACIPMIIDQVRRRQLLNPNGEPFIISPGGIYVMASIGADVSINAVVVREPYERAA